MPRHIIYGLFDYTNKEIFYIGQTKYIPRCRLLGHIATSKIREYPVSLRIKNMMERGVAPEILVLKQFETDLCRLTNENHGLFLEDIFIKEYSSLGTLLNISGNPLYDRNTQSFLEPKIRKKLQCVNGRYYIESDIIRYLHKDPYDPFKNDIFKSKL